MSLSCWSDSTARSTSSSSTVSVISRWRPAGSAPASCRAWAMRAGRSGSASWRAERFTDTKTSGRLCCQWASWPQAWPSSSAPRAPIRPESSATGMNWAGPMSGVGGSIQRASASKPSEAPVGQLHDGLVGELELAALEPAAEAQLEGAALLDLRAHLDVEHLDAGVGLDGAAPWRRRRRRRAGRPSRSRRRRWRCRRRRR